MITEKFEQISLSVRVALSRLNQRDQLLVLGGITTLVLLFLVLISFLVSQAIGREQRRVDVKTQQLYQVMALQGEYLTRQQEQAQRLRTLKNSRVRLISLVEEAAQKCGVEIGQLRPEDSEPSPNGIVESRVDLRASGLSVDRLEAFLNHLDSSQGIVIVRHLKVTRPYRKDVVDMEATVSTFKMKS